MKPMFSFRQLPYVLLAVGLLAAFGPLRGAQGPIASARAQSNSAGVCGSQPACYETNDFAAIITDFRVSDSNGTKVIDMTVRFQNKTNQPLILGYTDGSAMALDDQGNRYSLNGYAGPNAIRGIGRVAGNNIDPKFVLQPGGVGDALFELLGRPTGTTGVTFENDLTIREITALEGHQFALGGEFPLQFKGLGSGMGATAAASPGQAPGSAATALTSAVGSAGAVTAQIPCSTAGSGGGNAVSTLTTAANSVGGQNVTASANSTISGATNAIGNLRSIFGRKKAASAAPAPILNGAAPCVPAADNASTAASMATSDPNAAVSQTAGGSAAVAAPAIATRVPANATTTRVATAGKAPARVAATARRTQATTTTTRVATAAKPPAKAAKPAAKKPVASTAPVSK